MIALSFLAGLALVTIAGFGVALLGRASRILIPAAPVIGVIYFVIALHALGWFLPLGVALPIAAVPPLAAVVVVAFLRREWIVDALPHLPALAAVLAVGLIGGAVTLAPQILTGSTGIVQLTGSNDAFYYVSMSDWLAGHPIPQAPLIGMSPAVGADSPAYGDVPVGLAWGLRLGQELISGGLSSMLGTHTSAIFPGLIALWCAMIPAAAWLVTSVYRTPLAVKLVVGAVLAVAPSTLHQVANQNADSLLGTSLAIAAIGLVSGTLKRPRATNAVPLWVAAGAVAALAGTYTEYLPFIGLALAAIVLVRRWADWGWAVRRGLALVGIALVCAPVIWFRAATSFVVIASVAADSGAAQGIRDRVLQLVRWLPGAAVRDLPVASGQIWVVAYLVCAILIVSGIFAGLLFTGSRALSAAAIAAMLGGLAIAVRSGDYVTGRAADMIAPVLVIAASVGLVTVCRALLPRGSSTRRPWLAPAVGIVAVSVAVGVGATGVQAARSVHAAIGQAPSVDADYSDLVGWSQGTHGRGTAVVTATMFEQLWSSDALRHFPDVAYPSLRGDLGYRGNTALLSYWDGDVDGILIVGPGAFFDAEPAAVSAANGTFVRLDTRVGDVTVAVPTGTEWAWSGDDGIGGNSGARVLILSTRDSLSGCSLSATSPSGPRDVRIAGRQQGTLNLDGIPLSRGTARVTIEVGTGADEPFTLKGISCAS